MGFQRYRVYCDSGKKVFNLGNFVSVSEARLVAQRFLRDFFHYGEKLAWSKANDNDNGILLTATTQQEYTFYIVDNMVDNTEDPYFGSEYDEVFSPDVGKKRLLDRLLNNGGSVPSDGRERFLSKMLRKVPGLREKMENNDWIDEKVTRR